MSRVVNAYPGKLVGRTMVNLNGDWIGEWAGTETVSKLGKNDW